MSNFICPITLRETAGYVRSSEPIRIGIPFPRNTLSDPEQLLLLSPDATSINFQVRTLEYWPDKSVKWALFSFLGNIQPHDEAICHLSLSEKSQNNNPSSIQEKITTQEKDNLLVIDTGPASFTLSASGQLLDVAKIRGVDVLRAGQGGQLVLQNLKGSSLMVHSCPPRIEEYGPLYCSVRSEGKFFENDRKLFANFSIRYSFWASLSTAKVEFTLHNPRAALHPGGLWDLGDKASIFFKSLALQLGLAGDISGIKWQAEPDKEECSGKYASFTLHQNSSGGENWDSLNHVDLHGKKTVSFQGYHVRTDALKSEEIETGLRAQPWLKLTGTVGWIAGTIQHFWQNFPKSLEVSGDCLKLSLFPEEQGTPFELQGGERKRHTILLDFGLSGSDTGIKAFHQPVEVLLSPEWLEKTGTLPYFTAPDRHDCEQYHDYVKNIIEGQNSFQNKREIIDEYGWRNFGDQFADHEAVNHQGPEAFVSHYNNQYDFIQGALTHYLRSGDVKWRDLMVQQALHTIDIDLYHTDDDKGSYNHGQFWHTDHYQEARTSTHRSYSKKTLESGSARAPYGGGPSNENNYSSGLLHYYYLTGDADAAQAVINLAQWVFGLDDGAQTIFGLIDDGPTGTASQTVDVAFHKPGRGAGNSINTLVDAFRLTRDYKYITKAEDLLCRCIHPQDVIAELNLAEPEYRWSYLVFLQVLGKYLDFKYELGEVDYHFHYARESLLHYAEWMAENEVPYKDVLHKVEIPTETWPAQDIRKVHVFYLSAKYSNGVDGQLYRVKAAYFFQRCLDDLLSFETAFLTRPLIILAVYGQVYEYFMKNDYSVAVPQHNYDFRSPTSFVPQRLRLNKSLRSKLRNMKKQLFLLASGMMARFV